VTQNGIAQQVLHDLIAILHSQYELRSRRIVAALVLEGTPLRSLPADGQSQDVEINQRPVATCAGRAARLCRLDAGRAARSAGTQAALTLSERRQWGVAPARN
jgi:hypothetical protein